MLRSVPTVLVQAPAARKLSSIEIEPDPTACFRANGMAFAPRTPHWVAYFHLEGDPIEYNVSGISAPNARQAKSLAMLRLQDAGVDVAISH